MKITSVALPPDLTDRIDQAARDADRSRSWVIRKLLEQSLTAADRQDAFNAVAAAGLDDYAANAVSERSPNATAVIADSCADGHAQLAALDKIAKGAK